LEHYDIRTRVTAYHEHSRPSAVRRLLDHLDGADLALVSDAGTPTISDPGAGLVREALAAGHVVVPIPGPSAVLAALSVAGLPLPGFCFVGFLPRKAGQRRRLFEGQRERAEALVAFESPYRLLASLADLEAVLPERPVVVGRELTKMFEEVVR